MKEFDEFNAVHSSVSQEMKEIYNKKANIKKFLEKKYNQPVGITSSKNISLLSQKEIKK